MSKNSIGTITKEQQYKAMRKGNHDANFEANDGWTANEKVHKSVKSYSRKNKHKERY